MKYGWNDYRHPRFKEVSNIVSQAMQCPDGDTGTAMVIKNKIKAQGDNFTTMLLEYIEARYGSGHSMRYSILRHVFKVMQTQE